MRELFPPLRKENLMSLFGRADRTLEVSGSARIDVAPDEAVVDLTVMTEASSAAAAVAANAERTQSVIDAVAELPHRRIITTGLGVMPIYKYEQDTGVVSIIGYRASNTVRVTAAVADAGSLFDAGVEAGASQSSGISFRLRDEAPHREAALKLAMANAAAEAKIVADAAGVKLDGPQQIVVEPSFGPLLYRAEGLRAADAVPTPVLPEDIAVRANLRVVFRIRG
jgi:uncharacterized protein